MSDTTRIAATASLLGDPARANMLAALMDGRALTAKELAYAAHVSPQTTSGHLGKLTEAGLLTLQKQGRHHYYRLASPLVGQMLEGIMAVAGEAEAGMPTRRGTWRGGEALRTARTCYDHLAGRLGVELADALCERGHVALTEDGGEVTDSGHRFLRAFGAEPEMGRTSPGGSAQRWRAGASSWDGSRGSAIRGRWGSPRRDTRGSRNGSGCCCNTRHPNH
jgi:DNA-binding transcriptional ArsR family regulator